MKVEQLWEVLSKAWEEYLNEKIVRAFVHHAQVADAIYNCEGGDEFVKEWKGLSFGVRKVCEPYYKDGNDGKGYTGLDLTSLDERELGRAKELC